MAGRAGKVSVALHTAIIFSNGRVKFYANPDTILKVGMSVVTAYSKVAPEFAVDINGLAYSDGHVRVRVAIGFSGVGSNQILVQLSV